MKVWRIRIAIMQATGRSVMWQNVRKYMLLPDGKAWCWKYINRISLIHTHIINRDKIIITRFLIDQSQEEF